MNDISIVIQPPMKRTIFIGDVSYRLPFPYIVFAYSLNIRNPTIPPSGVLFCRFAQECPNENTLLFVPPLPNTYSRCSLCLGQHFNNINDSIDAFWNTKFEANFTTFDSCPTQRLYLSLKDFLNYPLPCNEHKLYQLWETLNVENILKVKWHQSGKYFTNLTFSQFLNDVSLVCIGGE